MKSLMFYNFFMITYITAVFGIQKENTICFNIRITSKIFGA